MGTYANSDFGQAKPTEMTVRRSVMEGSVPADFGKNHYEAFALRGDAVRQLQKRLEPGQLAAAIERDVAPALGTGDHRAHRDHQDIEQAMLDLAAAAWVLDRTEVLHQGLDGHGPPPRRRESRSSRVRPGQASEISCVAPAPDIHRPFLRLVMFTADYCAGCC